MGVAPQYTKASLVSRTWLGKEHQPWTRKSVCLTDRDQSLTAESSKRNNFSPDQLILLLKSQSGFSFLFLCERGGNGKPSLTLLSFSVHRSKFLGLQAISHPGIFMGVPPPSFVPLGDRRRRRRRRRWKTDREAGSRGNDIYGLLQGYRLMLLDANIKGNAIQQVFCRSFFIQDLSRKYASLAFLPIHFVQPMYAIRLSNPTRRTLLGGKKHFLGGARGCLRGRKRRRRRRIAVMKIPSSSPSPSSLL